MAPTLETKYVFTITARIAKVTTAGDIGHGVRRIIPIIGGEVRGEPGGSRWHHQVRPGRLAHQRRDDTEYEGPFPPFLLPRSKEWPGPPLSLIDSAEIRYTT